MSGRKPTTTDVRFEEKCEPRESGCIEWTGGTTPNGYGLFYAAGQMRPAHRWAYERVHGALIPGLDVCHSCDNKLCVNLKHLFAGTRFDNMRDAVAKGRMSHAPKNVGEAHGRAVLDEAAVTNIRALYPRWTLKELAERFSVSIPSIHRVVAGKTWKHI